MSNSNDTFIIKEATDSVHCATENVNEVKSSDEAKSSETHDDNGYSKTGQTDNLVFNRTNIESLGNQINLVDSDEENKLDMFCYLKCNEGDSDLLKQCRGVVFTGNDIVMKAFPYTTEFGHTKLEEINKHLGKFSDWTFYDAHEGALVRMFHFGGKWYVSTHRKLNAFRSKWASRESFGTSFKNALSSEEESNPAFKSVLPAGDNILERFQATLDISKQYMFLIRNTTDNRIVCSAPDRATVYHVGTFVEGQLVFNVDVKIPVPKEHKFLNIDELLAHTEKISYKDLQGIIGFTSDNRQVKIVHNDYQDLFHARGNEPSIKFRYLQIRMNRRLVNMLYHLYPDMVKTFDEYENTLYDIARNIYRSYVERFIKKRYVTVPREEFSVIRDCHSWHLTDRQNNRISLDMVMNMLNQQSPTNLNHMIRRLKLEQTHQNDQTNTTLPASFSKNKSVEQDTDSISPLMLPANGSNRKKPRADVNGRTATILPRKSLYVPKKKVVTNE